MSSKKQLQAKLKAVRASRKPTPAPKKGKENKASKPLPEKKKQGAPTVRWAQKDSHHLTNQLLALIEPSDLYRQSFGFTKISNGPVQTGGKKPPNLHAEIATAMFIAPPESKYTNDDLEVLTSVVGNRISA
ncbi:hypothetical protein DFH08DRAFT_974291 [Mycena albidolilacea]|uniref:Uncharacterized protein n=1 Tax=Mycena albidolilacea TaxID=1033008 RepID=A0AAD6Z7T8_9AGAR|nr:hypothetical protein DFH08DRAFT_974291 [Mycena albidolilacea]